MNGGEITNLMRGLKKYEKMKWNEVWKWEILETGLIQLWYNYEYRLVLEDCNEIYEKSKL